MPNLYFVIILNFATIFLLLAYVAYLRKKKNQEPTEQKPQEAQPQETKSLSEHELSLISDAKDRIKLIEQTYKEEANGLIIELNEMLMQNSQEAISSFNTSLSDLSKQAKEASQKTQITTTKEVETVLADFREHIQTLLAQEQEKALASTEKELIAAKAAIEEYKQKRLTAIDADIVAILEKTLALVLQKKLTLKEHTDLVYQSLEKAKTEKFIT